MGTPGPAADYLSQVCGLASMVEPERRAEVLRALRLLAEAPTLAERAQPPFVYRSALAAARPSRRGHRCHYCGAAAVTRDHVVPASQRGPDEWWNLVPACRRCNAAKADGASSCRCAFCLEAVRLFTEWRAQGARRSGGARQ